MCWCSARPELGQARPGFGTGRNRTTLTLDPLDPVSMDALVDALVPGMPPRARGAVTAHAQGLPLFAVETVRALIDRDIVQPVDGLYRLTGDIGELAVPDSLHALLAARLDALDPGVRQLAADAAVLGTSFPAEALIAVSGQDEPAVRAGLAELLRREVLAISADPLSPERGSYQFTQQMLRQVAYDTLSRRDRRTRHLKVAAHLRAAFPGDGEEVTDVIASHYLDALHAIPDDPDTGQIRGHAITALTRAAERAERTGAPARAATAYATAAHLTQTGHPGKQQGAAALWEHAADAAASSADYAAATQHASCARELYFQAGHVRAAARAQATAGSALRLGGRHAEAREQLTAAVDVLRTDPDVDTVRALGRLAMLEVMAGVTGRRKAHRRGAHPRPGPGCRHRSARQSVQCSRDPTSAALGDTPKRSPTTAKPRGSPPRPAITPPWEPCCSTCRTHWQSTTPRPRPRPPAPPPCTCA